MRVWEKKEGGKAVWFLDDAQLHCFLLFSKQEKQLIHRLNLKVRWSLLFSIQTVDMRNFWLLSITNFEFCFGNVFFSKINKKMFFLFSRLHIFMSICRKMYLGHLKVSLFLPPMYHGPFCRQCSFLWLNFFSRFRNSIFSHLTSARFLKSTKALNFFLCFLKLCASDSWKRFFFLQKQNQNCFSQPVSCIFSFMPISNFPLLIVFCWKVVTS